MTRSRTGKHRMRTTAAVIKKGAGGETTFKNVREAAVDAGLGAGGGPVIHTFIESGRSFNECTYQYVTAEQLRAAWEAAPPTQEECGDGVTWKAAPMFPAFEMCKETGEVRRAEDKRPMKQRVSNGYARTSLTVGGRSYPISVGRLQLLTYVGLPPTPRHTVDHIDPNQPLNNALSNLRWASPREQAKNRRKPHRNLLRRPLVHVAADGTETEYHRMRDACAAGYTQESKDGWSRVSGEQQHDLPGEEWKECLPGVSVSNMGRIWFHRLGVKRPGNVFMYPRQRSEHPLISMRGRIHLIHRLIAEAFLAKPSAERLYVRHKDGNKLNLRLDNLEWATPRDCQLAALARAPLQNPEVAAKPVDCNGVHYSSLNEAQQQTGVPRKRLLEMRNDGDASPKKQKQAAPPKNAKPTSKQSRQQVDVLVGAVWQRFDGIKEAIAALDIKQSYQAIVQATFRAKKKGSDTVTTTDGFVIRRVDESYGDQCAHLIDEVRRGVAAGSVPVTPVRSGEFTECQYRALYGYKLDTREAFLFATTDDAARACGQPAHNLQMAIDKMRKFHGFVFWRPNA